MSRQLLSMSLAAAATFAALASPSAAAQDAFTLQGKPVIAMLLFGPKNDGGWTQALDG